MQENYVFIECFNGRKIDEMYSIIDELSELNWKIYIYYLNDIKEDYFLQKYNNIYQLWKKDEKYFKVLNNAKYLFVNTNLLDSPDLNIGIDQTLIQLWHGIPFKHIGHDVIYSKDSETLFNKILDNELKHTNYLLIPNDFCDEVFKQAFNISEHTNLLKLGYPRNDYLFTKNFCYTKDDLGEHANKTIVYYAPTWNDKGVWSTFKFADQFDKLVEETSDTHFYIFSFHPGTENIFNFNPKTTNWMVNEKSLINNIDLFNLSDVLITDFSSIMFDYALTNKPVINFFTKQYYDEYTTNRGSYFDMYNDDFNIANDVEQLKTMLTDLTKLNFNVAKYAPLTGYSAHELMKLIKIEKSNFIVQTNKSDVSKLKLTFANKNYLVDEKSFMRKYKIKKLIRKVIK